MSKRQIFLVYDCDEWKSTSSLQLAMATTSVRRLKSFIAKKIERGDFEYDSTEQTSRQQAAQFRKDFDARPHDWLNSLLKFGFYDYTHDGEEI